MVTGYWKSPAYVYRNLDTATGTIIENAKLTYSDGGPFDGNYFGNSASISGNIALIALGRGGVLVYRDLDTVSNTVTENATLLPYSTDDPGGFGKSVSISGNIGLVGDPDRVARGHGWVFVFGNLDTVTGTITSADVVINPSDDEVEAFGWCVSLDGDRFVIGGTGTSAYTGSIASLTTLDRGGASEIISNISFASRNAWVIGRTTDGNTVTLSEGDEAAISNSDAQVYIGQLAGSDNNLLVIKGSLRAYTVYIGSISGNTGNTLQLEDTADLPNGWSDTWDSGPFGLGAFRIAPGNSLRIKGDYSNITSLMGYLESCEIQVWKNGQWQKITSANHASNITLVYSGGYTVVQSNSFTPTPTPTPPPGPTPEPTASPSATPTANPTATPGDENIQVAMYYYEQSQQAFDYFAGTGDMGAAYYYAYSNAASALYYQNVATDYEAAIIGYYVNTGYSLLYYYMIQGYTNYGLYLYNANLASASYILGYLSNYHTFSGRSIYYYYVDSDPAAAVAYYTQEMTLASTYQLLGYYSGELAVY